MCSARSVFREAQVATNPGILKRNINIVNYLNGRGEGSDINYMPEGPTILNIVLAVVDTSRYEYIFNSPMYLKSILYTKVP